MILSLIATGMLFFVATEGQTVNCDLNPDLTYFDNEQLEELRNSFRIGGDCSPIIWKDNFNNVLQSPQRQEKGGSDLNNQDRTLPKQFGNYESRRIIKQPEISPGNNFESGSQTELQKLLFSSSFPQENKKASDNYNKPGIFISGINHKSRRQLDLFRPNSNQHLESQGWSEEFFGKRPQTQDSFFDPDIQRRPPNHRHPEDFVGFEDQNTFFPPSRPRRPQNQRIPQDQDNIFVPGIRERPQNQEHPNEFLGPNDQRRPQNQDNFLSPESKRRPQSQRHPDSFSSQNQGDFFPPNNQIRPQDPRRPGDLFGSRNQQGPQNQDDNFFDSQRRPQSQDRPSDNFRPGGRRRPQIPNDIFRPDGQRRPQTIERPDNSFLRDDQRAPINQVVSNENFGNVVRPLIPTTTSTRRPESTTLPGPPTWATPPSTCVRSCPNTPEYNPVCGSDRVTYRNPGRLRCEQRCGKASVMINHYGNCLTTTARPRTTTATSTTPSRISTTPPTFSRNFG